MATSKIPAAMSAVVVVDGRCPQIAELLDGALSPLVRLAEQGQPLAAIGRLLRAKPGTRTLQLVAHGRPGAIQLGGRWITAAELVRHAAELASWEVARIELWSCRVAQDPGFVALLGELTGAEVWASSTALGRDANGSHWRLQPYGTGTGLAQAAMPPFRPETLHAWPYQLATTMDDQLNLFTVSDTDVPPPELVAALKEAEQQLAAYLQGEDALPKLFTSFNAGTSEPSSAWQLQAQAFLTALQAGQLSVRLELRSSEELLGAYGAFAALGPDGQPVIYLNEAWLPHLSAAALTRLILEESGHWIDSQINGSTDTPGDEGEAFAARVMGEELSASAWERINSENDQVRITIDGTEIEVEMAALLFMQGAYWIVPGATPNADPSANTVELETNSVYTKASVGSAGDRYIFVSAPSTDTLFR